VCVFSNAVLLIADRFIQRSCGVRRVCRPPQPHGPDAKEGGSERVEAAGQLSSCLCGELPLYAVCLLDDKKRFHNTKYDKGTPAGAQAYQRVRGLSRRRERCSRRFSCARTRSDPTPTVPLFVFAPGQPPAPLSLPGSMIQWSFACYMHAMESPIQMNASEAKKRKESSSQ
jgi:hypothetical protein